MSVPGFAGHTGAEELAIAVLVTFVLRYPTVGVHGRRIEEPSALSIGRRLMGIPFDRDTLSLDS